MLKANLLRGCVSPLLFALFLALSVSGCRNDDDDVTRYTDVHAPEPETEAEVEADSEFRSLAPVGENIISDATDWAVTELGVISDQLPMFAAMGEEVLLSHQGSFAEANAAYHAGDFATAESLYFSVLEEYPMHLGARNNLVLALVCQDRYEEALQQSILLGLIHPEYKGNLVNIQIPIYALGYSADETLYELYLSDLPEADSPDFDLRYADLTEPVTRAYAYNRVYANMEREMSEAEFDESFAALRDILVTLGEQDPEDADYTDLLLYLDGLQKLRAK